MTMERRGEREREKNKNKQSQAELKKTLKRSHLKEGNVEEQQ